MATIQTRIEARRGCGYRRPGGYYIVSNTSPSLCGAFPTPVISCQCCGQGIKPARGWTWIKPSMLNLPCGWDNCQSCGWKGQARLGLLWIGESFYRRPHEFVREWLSAGISRRLGRIPREFEVGKTWVLLAHRKGITGTDAQGNPFHTPAIFAAFKPTAIEYVITGKESEDELDRLEKRGFVLIKVIRDIDAQMDIDHLPEFEIRYSQSLDGAPYGYPGERVDIESTHRTKAISAKLARKNFKKATPDAKILSIKNLTLPHGPTSQN